jgi:hypothetical protein
MMWSDTGEAGGKGEYKGAVGYCKGTGWQQFAEGWQGGKGMDAAKGWLSCWTGGAGGNLAWWAKEVSGYCTLCMYLGLGIDSAMSGKQ